MSDCDCDCDFGDCNCCTFDDDCCKCDDDCCNFDENCCKCDDDCCSCDTKECCQDWFCCLCCFIAEDNNTTVFYIPCECCDDCCENNRDKRTRARERSISRRDHNRHAQNYEDEIIQNQPQANGFSEIPPAAESNAVTQETSFGVPQLPPVHPSVEFTAPQIAGGSTADLPPPSYEEATATEITRT